MGISNLKKKIIVGVLSTSLMGGASVAFADTDAGHQLGIWYNKQVSAAVNGVDGIAAKITHTRDVLVKAFDSDTDKLFDTAKAIGDENHNIEKNSKSSIETAKEQHINAIKRGKEHIDGNIDGYFDGVKNRYNAVIEEEIINRADNKQRSIDKVMETKKYESVEANKKSITETKNTAIEDLGKVITDTKQDIIDEIGENKEDAITKINNHTTNIIEDRKNAMENATSEYKETLINQIKNETEEKQNAAIKQLQADVFEEIAK